MTKLKPSETQIDKFKAAARELGADDDEQQFNEKLRRVARAPKGEKQKSKKG